MPYLCVDSVTTPDDFKMFSFIVMDPKQAGEDNVQSNVPAPAEGTVPPNSSERLVTVSQGGGVEKPSSKL